MGKQHANHYSKSFQLRVVKEVLSGKYSKEEARRIYKIGGNCTILYWMRKYSGVAHYRTPIQMEETLGSMGRKINNQIQSDRIKELEEEVLRERHRADIWQTIVEIAEEELGVDIKKKYGAKPFTKSKNKGK